MIINHYCNSFLSVEVNGKKIVCDPWIGATNESAWYSYPFFNQTSFLNEIAFSGSVEGLSQTQFLNSGFAVFILISSSWPEK